MSQCNSIVFLFGHKNRSGNTSQHVFISVEARWQLTCTKNWYRSAAHCMREGLYHACPTHASTGFRIAVASHCDLTCTIHNQSKTDAEAHTMLVPLVLPELSVAVAVAWPIHSHNREQVCNELLLEGAFTFWWQVCRGVIAVLRPSPRFSRAMAPLIVWPQAVQCEL